MRTVTWTVADQCYAVETRHLIEVSPVVETRPMQRIGPWMKGLMNYRGKLIPLLDACALMHDRTCEAKRASRILVLRVDPENDAAIVGLLVECVLGAETLAFDDAAAHPGMEASDAEYLCPVTLSQGGTVQLLDPGKLLRPEHQEVLFKRSGVSAP